MILRPLAKGELEIAALALLFLPGPLTISRADSARADLRQAVLEAEHYRARTDKELAILTTAAGDRDPEIQCLAVRALGRLERPELADLIRPLLSAVAPSVRREAVTAFGRALATDRPRAPSSGAILRDRLMVERDPEVRAALCEALGRLAYATAADVQSTENALVAATRSDGTSDAPPIALMGAARGLESLIRLRSKISSPAAETVERLRQLASAATDATVRRLAMASLAASGKLDGAFLEHAVQDTDDQVRRLAVRGTASLPSADAIAEAILTRGLKDPSGRVRYDALATHSRRHRSESCSTVLIALQDRSTQVRLQAIDLLGGGCVPDSTVTDTLARLADALPPSKADRGWHEPAHALVALARIAPDAVRPRMDRFVAHPQWQVRAYAARAAATVGDAALLEKLARDISDNVRTAAISGLIPVRQHAADPIYLEALAARDYQLIITAARGLAGTPGKADAVSALLASLARLTRERRDTARDPRIAIIQRLRETGSSENTAALTPYLADFDPRVATLAAEVLTGWTGLQHHAVSTGLDPGPPPQIKDMENLGSATARVTMRTGGTFELRLLPDVAPATVLRFIHLARTGYFDGLTFHRVEPNFVIQGGSPGANEYMGDARFMRDELGRLMHARGTVGISTRGRDTGDAQIFVNLVDNPRLDSDYTVFAETIQGLDVIDGVLEGDTIDHIEIRPIRSAARRK